MTHFQYNRENTLVEFWLSFFFLFLEFVCAVVSTFYKHVSGCMYVEMNSHGMYTELHSSKLLAVSVLVGSHGFLS
jgi:hypothetical protein